VSLVVITGTGTGVGKTYVTSRLVTAIGLHRGAKAIKPIESGYGEGQSDAATIGGGDDWETPLYALAEPLAPSLAARLAGVEVEVPRVVEWVRGHAQPGLVCLVESAGGLFTPVDEAGRTNLDLVRALEPCLWLLVAPNRLGVLSDVGACVRAARGEHRGPDALVLSSAAPDASSLSNAAELRHLWPTLPLFEIGQGEEPPGGLVRLLSGV
jgi:dethiobiotin synthetase